MVHIARGALDRAESMLREGAIVQDRQAHLRQRYPAKGLHWLLGLVRLAQGDLLEARREFDREVEVGPWQLYAAEFAMNAHDGAGFAALAQGEPGAAVASFGRALELYPEHARSLVGLGAAHAADWRQAGRRRRLPARDPCDRGAARRRTHRRGDNLRSLPSRGLRPAGRRRHRPRAPGRPPGITVHRLDRRDRAALCTPPAVAWIRRRALDDCGPRALNSAFFSLSSRLDIAAGPIVAHGRLRDWGRTDCDSRAGASPIRTLEED